VSFQAADGVVGVKEIHVRVEDNTAAMRRMAFIDPGDTFTLPALTVDGVRHHLLRGRCAGQHGGAADAPGEAQTAPLRIIRKPARTAPDRRREGRGSSSARIWKVSPNDVAAIRCGEVGALKRSGSKHNHWIRRGSIPMDSGHVRHKVFSRNSL
jgi:hypothetical protein